MAYTTIDDPSAHFQTLLWAGNDSNRSLTNTGNSDLQPDWVWIKCRTSAFGNALFDSSRGVTKYLSSNSNNAELNQPSSGYLASFDSDGFSAVTGSSEANPYNNWNRSSNNYVAWQWKANGGTTSSNSDGDITATVQANTTAGFSIVTYTGNGNGSDQTVGHGLGAECKVVFAKIRTDSGDSWRVFHESVSQSAGGNLFLNGTSTLDTGDPARIKSTNTSTFTLLAYTSTYNALNASSKNYVAYCFAEKKGYSKFGSYTGNANADGAFVYTGFKPAWVMTKRTDSSQNWAIYDNKRDGINVIDKLLYPNGTDAEVTTGGSLMVDFLSNGFKWRGNSAISNGSGNHIYMAFAENPFVSSKGVPTTAR